MPQEMDSQLDSNEVLRSINGLNRLFYEAEHGNGWDVFAGCVTCHLWYYLGHSTHYERLLDKIEVFVKEENERYYNKIGFSLQNPLDTAKQYLELRKL
ncbi:hypothetical protein MP638_004947 [Amoeboaphelidium occidentale]|nr:hypothetical protein MP638_004947 [Amoeboaphelidium occidentale]